MYLGTKYDLDATDVPTEFVHARLAGAATLLFHSSASVLELPEPLWMRFLPTEIVLLGAWHAGRLVHRGRRTVVTYAMENNDLGSLLTGDRTAPAWLVRGAGFCLGALIAVGFDRIAFGSEGARALYTGLPFVGRMPSRLFPHLPQPALDTPRSAVPDSVVFLGRLEERKGLRALIRAWDDVEKASPTARLRIIGSGPLDGLARAWAAERPNRREALGPVPHKEVRALVGDRAVAVAPSQRDGRWREQIGLPILESLALGLTVVTTDETGIARWLREHGHSVVAAGAPQALSAAILAALARPLDRVQVLRSLPRSRGRIDAAWWLYEGSSATTLHPMTAEDGK
ncbi:glycosyltransferase family 4 protein [Rathayibacter sp. Leaf185]|uniref:glycosyltransferase family 4 protein n=1 Tax=Rathayibacter sp. Leaf185 TaxID=1736292 RepID=UPI0018D24A44|nr:glycosyltransferase family 4 protein [Rathayibacter sp. Leaf185]